MRKIALLALVALYCFSADAQQDPQFTQWMFDRLSVNPAFAGANGDICITGFYRDQWDMLERDPKTVMFNGHMRLPETIQPNIGVGVNFYNDRLGNENNTVVKLNGAWHQQLGSGDILSAGVSLGMYNKTLGTNWIAADGVDNDNAISKNEQTAGAFDLGLGIYYHRPGSFYAGISSTHLTGQDLTDLNIEVARHYWIMGGAELPLPFSGDVTLRPNLLVKTDGVSTSFDLNANVLFNNLFWVGASYRLQDAISPMAGLQYALTGWENGNTQYIPTLKAGYSYDVTTSELKNYSAGSHEIMIGICIAQQFKPVRKRYTNPRYMGREL